MCVLGGKKCLFFGKFRFLCFRVTTVLRFTLLPYHQWVDQQLNFLYYAAVLTWWLSMHWIIMGLFQVLINTLPLDHLQWFPLQLTIPSILWKTIGMTLHKNLTQKLLFQGRKCWCCVRRLFYFSHLKHLLHQFKLLLLIHHYHYSDSAFQVKHLSSKRYNTSQTGFWETKCSCLVLKKCAKVLIS